MWALDVDPRHGGDKQLDGLEADYERLPRSLRSTSGGGGLHILFAWPDDGQPLSNANGLPPGLDTRGEGGFIVLPPSPHVSGGRYEWLIPPKQGELEPAPGWLLELARQRQRPLPLATGAEEGSLVPIGHRHQALVSFCGHLRSMGLGEEALVECGRAFLRHQVEVDEAAQPINWEHAERSIRSIARRYPAEMSR
jgi:putative DNA primase/helicase